MKLPKILLKSRGPIIATDAIILNDKKEILLTRRNIKPFKGYWVIPGGHVKYEEKVENAMMREVKEETGLSVKIIKLLGVYSNPKRDPRYHIVSVIFLAKPVCGAPKTNKEVSEIRYFKLNELPSKIGFDHRHIINSCLINPD